MTPMRALQFQRSTQRPGTGKGPPSVAAGSVLRTTALLSLTLQSSGHCLSWEAQVAPPDK